MKKEPDNSNDEVNNPKSASSVKDYNEEFFKSIGKPLMEAKEEMEGTTLIFLLNKPLQKLVNGE